MSTTFPATFDEERYKALLVTYAKVLQTEYITGISDLETPQDIAQSVLMLDGDLQTGRFTVTFSLARACKILGIKPTHKHIQAFIRGLLPNT